MPCSPWSARYLELVESGKGLHVVRYTSAPVTEVSASLVFVEDLELDAVSLFRLQERWTESFPDLEVTHAIDGGSSEDEPGVIVGLPPLRIWASSPGTGLLIQSQSDMLLVNWRAKFSDGPYPHFVAIQKVLAEALGHLIEYQAERGAPEPIIMVAGFDYFNRIPLDSSENPEDVLSFIAKPKALESVAGRQISTSYEATFERTVDDGMMHSVRTRLRCRPAGSTPGEALMLSVETRALASDATGTDLVLLDTAHRIGSEVFDLSIEEPYRAKWGRM